MNEKAAKNSEKDAAGGLFRQTKAAFSRSSLLTSIPALVVVFVCAALAAFFGQGRLALALMFVFLLAGASRLWAVLAARHVQVRITGAVRGMFPGEEAQLEVTVHNGKFLPLVWLELFFPLARSLCLIPQESRKPDSWEVSALEEEGASTELVGQKRCAFLLWYETARLPVRFRAERRGVYTSALWRLRTGDGFGLTQIECPLPREERRSFAVYPRLVAVRPDLFLRNLWNADTGTRGVMEDPTVIRSTRDYQSTDSLKHINWRLTARGLPLCVNVYEDILPKGVHFIFDGESFSGKTPHLAQLEDALSILASELVRLDAAQVRCGLSLCRGRGGEAVNLFAAQSATEDLLCALAAYEPAEPLRDGDGIEIVNQRPVFDEAPLLQAARGVGRFYYIAYSAGCLKSRPLLGRTLSPENTSVLTYVDAKPYGEYETVCLCSLKEENHGA